MAGKLSWLKINGVEAPTPCEFTPIDSDFDSDDSERDETGVLHRTVIRRSQHAPKFKWKLSGKELAVLLKMIDATSLQVTYFDIKTQQLITFTGYPQATRQCKLLLQAETYNDCLWEFECSFIEY